MTAWSPSGVTSSIDSTAVASVEAKRGPFRQIIVGFGFAIGEHRLRLGVFSWGNTVERVVDVGLSVSSVSKKWVVVTELHIFQDDELLGGFV